MPRKRQFRRLRRLRLIGGSGVFAVMLGGAAAFFGAGDAVHHRPGGLVGVVAGLTLVACGVVAVAWALRAVARVTAAEWRDLRARGSDDGLPRGAFQDGPRVGLEASDRLLLLGVVMAGIGLVFLVSGVTDPQVGWRFGLSFSLVGFLPAALLFWLGTGVKYWLTQDGVTRRDGLHEAVRWADIERIVPASRGIPATAGEYADAIELQVRSPKQAKPPRRWFGTDFTIKLPLLEIGRDDLLTVLRERVRSAHNDA